jgi:hypothetical protein
MLPDVRAVQYWAPADKQGKRYAVHLYIRDGQWFRVYFRQGQPDRYVAGIHEPSPWVGIRPQPIGAVA